jgi:hypothetical protein
MLKKILLILLVAIGAFCAYAATRPSEFSVTRSATLPAPPEAVYPLVSDFHRWAEWSPWEKLDPGMKRTFDGPPAGQGAIYGWTGNDKVGQGKMTIFKAQAPDAGGTGEVGIKLEFIKPFASTSDTVFALRKAATGTDVSWTMSGPVSFLAKVFTIFRNMDAAIGPDFEKGLNNLRPVAEAEARKRAAAAATAPAAPGAAPDTPAAAPAAPAAR